MLIKDIIEFFFLNIDTTKLTDSVIDFLEMI